MLNSNFAADSHQEVRPAKHQRPLSVIYTDILQRFLIIEATGRLPSWPAEVSQEHFMSFNTICDATQARCLV